MNMLIEPGVRVRVRVGVRVRVRVRARVRVRVRGRVRVRRYGGEPSEQSLVSGLGVGVRVVDAHRAERAERRLDGAERAAVRLVHVQLLELQQARVEAVEPGEG